MGSPAIVPFSNAQAAAKSGVRHAIGMLQAVIGDSNSADPNWLSKQITVLERTWDLLMMVSGGAVVQFVSTGLTCDVYPANYQIGSTRYTYAGGTLLLTANATNYVYLDADQVAKAHTSAFPADVFRLAIVTTDASNVTANKDVRGENYRIGAGSWWNTAAGADVDMAGFDLLNTGELDFNEPTTLNIASDTITPTQGYHIIRSETIGVADQLNTITATAGKRRLLILRIAADSGAITFAGGAGNLELWPQGALTVGNPGQHVILLQNSDTTWITVVRPDVPFSTMTGTISANANRITQLRRIEWYSTDSATLASDTIAWGGFFLQGVRSEGGAALDSLNFCTGGSDGDIVVFSMANAAEAITVNHSLLSTGFRLAGGASFKMTSQNHYLVCKWRTDHWEEISRSHWNSGCPKDWVVFAAGTPSIVPAGYGPQIVAKKAGVITSVHGRCRTAPSGAALIVDVRINGSSIFASQAEMVNIAAAATADESAIKNAAYAAGDVIDVEFEQVNSAADVTLTIHCQESPMATP